MKERGIGKEEMGRRRKVKSVTEKEIREKENSEGCMKLKVSKYPSEISTLAKGKQGQGSH